MKKLSLLMLVIFPLCMFAQEKGIHFEHGLSWAAVQAKAKAEHKFIFMDCFTTWCGPCKYMSANVFPMEEVGSFMNEKFISVKLQLDTTDEDNDEVKSWYKDGDAIEAKYNVRAYPTYLFFDEDGNAVHRFVGGGPAPEFLTKVKNALNPETQYYSLLNEYKAGKKDSAFLYKIVLAAYDAYDLTNAKNIAKEYLSTQSNLYTKENLWFLANFTQTSTDTGFNIILSNMAKVDAVLGEGSAKKILKKIILPEEVYRKISAESDWPAITASVTKKYPALAPELLAEGKVVWYQSNKDWNNFQTAVVDFMKKFGSNAEPNQLNAYAWTVFENCSDMKCVEEALEWSKRSFKDNNEPGFIDTYANILYRLGKKDDAILWEQKAMDLAVQGDKQGYQDVIDKMKKGEKTWN